MKIQTCLVLRIEQEPYNILFYPPISFTCFSFENYQKTSQVPSHWMLPYDRIESLTGLSLIMHSNITRTESLKASLQTYLGNSTYRPLVNAFTISLCISCTYSLIILRELHRQDTWEISILSSVDHKALIMSINNTSTQHHILYMRELQRLHVKLQVYLSIYEDNTSSI